MTNDLSIFHLIANASVVVQLVMIILLVASIISWTFIFSKQRTLRRAYKVAEEFEEIFYSGSKLSDLYRKLSIRGFEPTGIEKIFLVGYKEYLTMQEQQDIAVTIRIESTEKVMRIELNRELDRLDETLPFLATVGSTSPYIGLFGTVWGIMNSFRALGDIKQATLAHVAPGIAEALIATAIGLFAAIPAVIAYNRFSSRLDRLAGRYELFIEEFVVLLKKRTKQ